MPSKSIDLRVHHAHGAMMMTVPVTQLVIAGWAGRNDEDVQAHIRELEAIGIAPPTETPIYYRVSGDNLTSASTIEVVGPDTSGEVEVVLIAGPDATYVAIGSDHTDRKLEAISVSLSKQICGKPVSMDAWLLDDVADHWDSLQIVSRAGPDYALNYQFATVASLRRPDELIRIFEERGGAFATGTVMYCGTVPVIGSIRYSQSLELRLIDPVREREIVHSYDLVTLPVLG